MSRVFAIAINSLREAVRDKVLAGILGITAALLVFSLAMAELSLDQQYRVVVDMGLSVVSTFSVVVAVFLGSSLLYKEIEKKTLYMILPKPVLRSEFLLGKYLGILITVLVFVALSGTFHILLVASVEQGETWSILLVLAIVSVGVAAGFWRKDAAFGTGVAALFALASVCIFSILSGIEFRTFAAAYSLIIAEAAIVTAIAMLFSSFSTPFLTGAFSLGVWVAGRGVAEMLKIQERNLPDLFKSVIGGLVRVIPNLYLYVPDWYRLSHPEAGGGWAYVGHAWLLALAYVVAMLGAAILIFRRRDFL